MESVKGRNSKCYHTLLPMHVIKAMFKGMSYCSVEKSDRDECRRIIWLLVHAKTEVEYKDLKQELFDEANDDFKVYFERNWE